MYKIYLQFTYARMKRANDVRWVWSRMYIYKIYVQTYARMKRANDGYGNIYSERERRRRCGPSVCVEASVESSISSRAVLRPVYVNVHGSRGVCVSVVAVDGNGGVCVDVVFEDVAADMGVDERKGTGGDVGDGSEWDEVEVDGDEEKSVMVWLQCGEMGVDEDGDGDVVGMGCGGVNCEVEVDGVNVNVNVDVDDVDGVVRVDVDERRKNVETDGVEDGDGDRDGDGVFVFFRLGAGPEVKAK